MKKRLLPFFLLIIIHSTYAQDSSFQLKNYKYRTPGYTALELNLGFSGWASDNNALESFKRKESYWQLQPSNLAYYRSASTDKKIHSSVISFSPAGNYSSLNLDDSITKSKSFQYNVYWNFNDRFYIKNNWFWEWGTNLNHTLTTGESKYNSQNSTGHHILAENTFMLGIGKGRIENVTDAQTALYILNDLEQQGLLNNHPSPEITRQFAQLITAVNNKRVFDNRRRRIYEFTQIDSFLKSSGLISVNDIRYFTTINDNWVMAFNPYRTSGANWFIRLQPAAGILKDNNYFTADTVNSSVKGKKTYASLTPLIGYENNKPLNLKWQRNFETIISFQKKWNSDENRYGYMGSESLSKIDTREWITRLYSRYGWGYFPNNRTVINAYLQLDASFGKSSEPVLYKEMKIIKPGMDFSADYFLSYRTRLTANWNLNYKSSRAVTNTNETVNSHELSSGISFGLTHSIL
ncbi:MAG TPA: hypothetical protein VJ499_07910 [Flavisolibacter sp.]|nr:hypothetical protein [Flavisolibacter sp.]